MGCIFSMLRLRALRAENMALQDRIRALVVLNDTLDAENFARYEESMALFVENTNLRAELAHLEEQIEDQEGTIAGMRNIHGAVRRITNAQTLVILSLSLAQHLQGVGAPLGAVGASHEVEDEAL